MKRKTKIVFKDSRDADTLSLSVQNIFALDHSWRKSAFSNISSHRPVHSTNNSSLLHLEGAQKQEYNAKFGDKWPLHPNGKSRENSFWKYVFPTFAFSCLGRQQSMLVFTQPSFDHGSACFLCNSLINHSEFSLILSWHQVKTGNQNSTLSHCHIVDDDDYYLDRWYKLSKLVTPNHRTQLRCLIVSFTIADDHQSLEDWPICFPHNWKPVHIILYCTGPFIFCSCICIFWMASSGFITV